ncbi:MAG: zinc-dependent metalloprotease, partial [Dysgonamonadaceae bacterium]|nr:zinc-dependent metalloprotease [Dysgonamonadaceae bacterium]
MRKSIIFLLATAVLLSVAPNANASIFKKKKKPALTAKVEPKKQSPYEKLLKGKAETAKSSFITLHKADGKLYFELPLKYIDRELLIASTISEVSYPDFANIGYKPSGTTLFKFSKRDSTINFSLTNNSSITDDANIGIALKKVSTEPTLFSYPIKAYNPDSSAVVFDVTSLFTTDVKLFQFFPTGGGSGLMKISTAFKKETSALGAIKAFDDNLTIKSTLSYALSISLLGMVKLVDDYPFTATVTRSILLLPEDKMTPRISDSRVGIFNNSKRKYTQKEDKVETYSVAHRWRVEPKDVEAYKRGELTEPVKPIVFYVDNAFPELWQQPIKEAIEAWNDAFEKIGFKNVVQAKSFPTAEENPDFDPDNLKYSCVRYLPSSTANAMGPSWVDPATGEILTASVLVYGNIVQLINSWRFVQTAQLDERVRAKKLPDDVMKESIIYVVSHEIGHCLGFMHNMASSAAFPVDSLRSASFTQANGTTPCIMDYARFNYIAQPEDKGIRLTPPKLGTYDYFLIKWNYQYLPGITSEWDEQATIEGWVDEHAGDPVYRYGRQQMQSRYDPSAIEEDLGNDPIKASDYGIKNLKYILANLEGWITDDNDYSHRQSLYSQIQTQYYRYLRNVMYNIGGIYLTEVKEGTQGKNHQPVAKEVQKQSVKWLLNEYKNIDWVDNKSLKENTSIKITGSHILRDRILKDIRGLTSNVVLSAYYSDSPYSIEEFTDDIYNATWSNLLQGKALTPGDKALQQAMVDLFCEPFQEKKPAASNPILGYAPSVDEIIAYRLDESRLVERYPDIFRQYEEKHGLGAVALLLEDGCGNHDEHEHHFGTPGYGFQSKVSVSVIDETNSYLQNLAVKSRNLLK